MEIGGNSGAEALQPVSSATANFDSALPFVITVSSTGIDGGHPVLNFAYGDEFWTGDDSKHCSGLGADSGKTE